MTDSRIPTELWVKAHVHRLSAQGVPVVIARRGDRHGGMVILKINQLSEGCRVLAQTRDLDGNLAWLPALDGKTVPESEADAWIGRQAGYDPDLWVVEVETRSGEHGFEGKVL